MRLNDEPREMPVITPTSMKLTRVGSSVTLTSNVGLTVVSDFESDFHIVHVDGWYFNKVGGLLGNFDFEHYNDMMMPDRSTSDSERPFFNAWEVSKKNVYDYFLVN